MPTALAWPVAGKGALTRTGGAVELWEDCRMSISPSVERPR